MIYINVNKVTGKIEKIANGIEVFGSGERIDIYDEDCPQDILWNSNKYLYNAESNTFSNDPNWVEPPPSNGHPGDA